MIRKICIIKLKITEVPARP